jgi:quinol monooxygenase YgiN
MNKRLLQKHQRGEESAAELALITSENLHTDGHPSCAFCLERYFDKAALYAHMQRTYFTCHLCPQQYMFRYYVDATAVQEHHRRDHIVCSICEAVPSLVEAGVAISFRDVREYSEHMRHFHNNTNAVCTSQRGLVSDWVLRPHTR